MHKRFVRRTRFSQCAAIREGADASRSPTSRLIMCAPDNPVGAIGHGGKRNCETADSLLKDNHAKPSPPCPARQPCQAN